MGEVREVTSYSQKEGFQTTELYFMEKKRVKLGEIWRLTHDTFEETSHGVTTEQSYNILYTIPCTLDLLQYYLPMKYDKPFWKLEGKAWANFVKRCAKFSEYRRKIPSLHESILEKAREEMRE